MKQQTKNTIWAAALVAIIGTMGALAGHDAEAEQEQTVMQYCEGVAVFEAEKARGVPLDRRVGHRDWDDDINVAEQCPGMRPAGPAVDEYAPAQYAMPEAATDNQLVQF